MGATTTTSTERLLERARALRALRDGAATKGEAEAAAHALAALIEKHRLDEAEAEGQAGGVPAEEIVVDEIAPLLTYKRMSTETAWRFALLEALAEHHGVAVYRRADHYRRSDTGRRTVTYALVLSGRASDIAIVRYMYAWLEADMDRLGNRERSNVRTSWLLGFAVGIRDQLKAGRREARVAANPAAIVHLDQRIAKADAHMAAHREVGSGVHVGMGGTKTNLVAALRGRVAGAGKDLDEPLEKLGGGSR